MSTRAQSGRDSERNWLQRRSLARSDWHGTRHEQSFVFTGDNPQRFPTRHIPTVGSFNLQSCEKWSSRSFGSTKAGLFARSQAQTAIFSPCGKFYWAQDGLSKAAQHLRGCSHQHERLPRCLLVAFAPRVTGASMAKIFRWVDSVGLLWCRQRPGGWLQGTRGGRIRLFVSTGRGRLGR